MVLGTGELQELIGHITATIHGTHVPVTSLKLSNVAPWIPTEQIQILVNRTRTSTKPEGMTLEGAARVSLVRLVAGPSS